MIDMTQQIESTAQQVCDNLVACQAHPTHGSIASEALLHLADVLTDLTCLEANGYPQRPRDVQRVYVYLLHREIVALGFCGDPQVRIYASEAAMGVMLLTARLREMQSYALPLGWASGIRTAQGAML